MPARIRRVDASKYRWDDPHRYIDLKDCPSEPELIKAYCDSHPRSACLGGYGYMGCRPLGRKREEFVKYDFERKCFVRADGTMMAVDETYCGRKIPSRVWKGKEYSESRIWAMAGLGQPDMIDGDLIIEAKGGLPSLSKAHTALGQLMMYREHEPSFRYGFLFPAIWLQAENVQRAFSLFSEERFEMIPLEVFA